MGLFDFFKKDPTTYWSTSSKQKLKLDLNDFSVNKLKLGAAKDEISRFGKPDNKKAYKNDEFEHVETGLKIFSKNNEVNAFWIAIEEHKYSFGLKEANLTIINTLSQQIEVSKGMLRTELIEKLRMKVDETDEDENDIVDYIKTKDNTIELESNKNGKLLQVNLYIND